jgi:hypothetical protein
MLCNFNILILSVVIELHSARAKMRDTFFPFLLPDLQSDLY